MAFWDVVVPVSSVVVTGSVAVWSKVIDARAKRDDRQHARALDYEGRVWEAKNKALRRMISACRELKQHAAHVDGDDSWRGRRNPARHAELLDSLNGFVSNMGGEEGISEITAYASEPVRESLEALLAYRASRLGSKIQDPVLHNVVDALKHLRFIEGEIVAADTELLRPKDCGELEEKARQTLQVLATVEVDAVEVVGLCDALVDSARLDIQGRN